MANKQFLRFSLPGGPFLRMAPRIYRNKRVHQNSEKLKPLKNALPMSMVWTSQPYWTHMVLTCFMLVVRIVEKHVLSISTSRETPVDNACAPRQAACSQLGHNSSTFSVSTLPSRVAWYSKEIKYADSKAKPLRTCHQPTIQDRSKPRAYTCDQTMKFWHLCAWTNCRITVPQI